MNHPTRLCLSLLLAGGMTATLPAQDTPPPPPPEVSERSPEELDDLLGPIALYPDDLVALILPAASEPTDIVLAARYHENDGAMDEIDQQHWDESVRAIAHFPDLVEWMSKNLTWTQDVGDAFLLQPAEVMKSIQRLRTKAYAAGTLRDTEQQKVLVDGGVIRIVSAQEEVVYVPRYRTEVVYVDRPVYYSEPWITFGIGWSIGSWHRWECDWYSNRIWVFDHHDHWRSRRWNVHVSYNWRHYDHGRAWCPPRSHVRYNHRRDWDRNRDHRRDRHVNRPTPYVENETRHRNWRQNRDRNQNNNRELVNRERREGFTGDRRNQERTDNQNNNRNSNNGDRRTRSPQGNRGTPDSGNPSVIANNPQPPVNNPPPNASNSRGRNSRNDEAGSGDRRDYSRGSRNSPRVNPTVPAVVATNNTPPPPAVNSSRTTTVNGRRAYAEQPRAVRNGSGSDQTPRAYRTERSNPPDQTNANRSSRSETSRSSASSPRQYNNSTNATVETTENSSSRNNGGSGRSSSSNSGSRSSGRNDDGDRGNRSNSGDGGRNGRNR